MPRCRSSPAATARQPRPGRVSVNGTKGTAETVFTYNGKKDSSPSKEKVVKKNGTWYFADFT